MNDTHNRSEQEVIVMYGKTPLHALAETILNKLANYRGVNPIAARVRVLKENCEIIYYISRYGNQGDDLVSYNAPLGRLAALPLGKHVIELPADLRGRKYKDVIFEILEKAIIAPEETVLGWDSRPTIIFNDRFGSPLTVQSLQVLLQDAAAQKKVSSEQESSNKSQSNSPQKQEDTVILDVLRNLAGRISATNTLEKISDKKVLPEERASVNEDLLRHLRRF